MGTSSGGIKFNCSYKDFSKKLFDLYGDNCSFWSGVVEEPKYSTKDPKIVTWAKRKGLKVKENIDILKQRDAKFEQINEKRKLNKMYGE